MDFIKYLDSMNIPHIINLYKNKCIWIKGSLHLAISGVRSLPNGLSIGGNLSMRFSRVKNLPGRLYIRNSLILSSSKVNNLPEDLYVGDTIYLDSYPIMFKNLTINKQIP